MNEIKSAFCVGDKVQIDAEVINIGKWPGRVGVRIAGHDNSGYVLEHVVHQPTLRLVRGPVTRAQIANFADLWYQRNGGYRQDDEPFKIVEEDIAEIASCLRSVGVEVEP